MLQQEQISDYVKSGGVACPYCGSRDIDAGPMEADGDYCWCVVNCSHCDMQWQDSYRLVGIIEMHDGPFVERIIDADKE